MSRRCTVCTSPDLDRINSDLVTPRVSIADVSRKYAIEDDAVRRHAQRHLTPDVRRAAGLAELNHLSSIINDLRRLWDRAEQLGKDAEQEGDRRGALASVREARECIALLAKLTGDLDERPQLNVLVAPEWRTVQVVILDALGGYPEAREAVSTALLRLESPS